ncbi:MAG: ABC transporter substrate-binding protein [Terrisporobacter sp.]
MSFICCLCITACSKDGINDTSINLSTEVIIAIPSQKINYLPYYVAMKNGYFEEEGITVKEKIVKDSSKVYEEVSGNKADIGCGTIDSLLYNSREYANDSQLVFAQVEKCIEKDFNKTPSYVNDYTDSSIYVGMYANKSFINHSPGTIQKISNAICMGEVFISNSKSTDIASLISDIFPEVDKDKLVDQIEFMKNKNFFPQNPITLRDDYESALSYLKSKEDSKISETDLFNKLIDNTYAYKSVNDLDS